MAAPSTILAVVRKEGILALGAVITALDTSLSGNVPQGIIPLAVAALLRLFIHQTTTKGGNSMADLAALRQATSDLTNAVTSVQNVIATLKSQATPQADVDVVTSQVQQATQSLQVAAQ